jgi:hypothetical protein
MQLFDAVRNNKRQKHEDVAKGIANLGSSGDELAFDQMMKDPFGFLEKQISQRCKGASLVLWKQTNGTLSAGILCKTGMLEALYVLVLFQLGSGQTSKTGECVVCGKIFDRKRGLLRKTCSTRCRKRASLDSKRGTTQ